MGYLSRRHFLASTAAAGMLGAVPSLLISGRPALAMPTTTIRVGTRVIEVNGRPATVFGLTQPDGSHGLSATHSDHAPLEVRAGERVEITFEDRTTMAHPMHLHGHHFQVVAINGERFAGAMRDTVLVPPRGNVTIAFEANNPGKWALHCHHLHHMASGMMTTLEYRS